MDMFSTGVLQRVVAELHRPKADLLNRYFPTVQTEESEEIHFDVVKGGRKLAPFVSPLVAGRVVRDRGFTTKTLKPAYVKDKRKFDPAKALKRTAGEKIGGSLTPAQRRQIALRAALEDQLDRLTRRKEWMATEIMRTGKVVISGEDYPTTEVDFGRDPSLSVTVTEGSQWGQEGAKPLDDLQDWVTLGLKIGGTAFTDVIMTVDVWKVFRADPQVRERLDLRRVQQDLMRLEAMARLGLVYMGTIDAFNIFVYQDYYETDEGVLTPYLPDGTLIMTSGAVEGVQNHGAILDEAVGENLALEYFVKSWIENDPGVRFLLMQSAPLVTPYRPDATFCASDVVPAP